METQTQQIKTLSDINTESKEGKYLMAALAMLTVTVHPDKEPDTVIGLLEDSKNAMYPHRSEVKPSTEQSVPSAKQYMDKYARKNGHEDWNWLATQESPQTLLSCTKEVMESFASLCVEQKQKEWEKEKASIVKEMALSLIEHTEKCLSYPMNLGGDIIYQKGYRAAQREYIEFMKMVYKTE